MVITKAAILFENGEIIEGTDYGYIINLAHKLGLNGDRIEGFVSSDGSFLLPRDAAKVAFNAGQTAKRLEQIAPEDLWPVLID